MTETIIDGKWHWYSMQDDLWKYISGVSIDPLTVRPHFCSGEYNDKLFTVTWVRDTFMLVSMQEYSRELIDAFTAVVGYSPIVQYKRYEYVTVEWDKKDPGERIVRLEEMGLDLRIVSRGSEMNSKKPYKKSADKPRKEIANSYGIPVSVSPSFHSIDGLILWMDNNGFSFSSEQREEEVRRTLSSSESLYEWLDEQENFYYKE